MGICLKDPDIPDSNRAAVLQPNTKYLLPALAHFRPLGRQRRKGKNIICPQYSFRHMISPMESVDQQFRQLKENYERMTEGELAAIAERAYDLTEIAREALQAVIMEKGLDLQLKLDPLAPLRPEDEDLVIFRWEPNGEEAGWTMKALAAAGIPSFLCVEVRGDDVKRAKAALHRAIADEFEKEDDDPEEKKQYAILCPKCRSTKVVFKGRTSKSGASLLGVKFQWICEACGHQWVDNGVTQEVAGGQSWPGEEFPSRDEKSSEELDPK
jgi:rubrerythrin